MRKILSLLFLLFIFSAATKNALAASTYTLDEVAQHNTASDCWMAIDGNVYDVTQYIPQHDNQFNIRPWCGTDATTDYHNMAGRGQDHNAKADQILASYMIGTLDAAGLAASQTAVTTASQSPVTTVAKSDYNVFLPVLLTFVLYFLTAKLLAKPKHDFIWNSVMLLGLIPSAMFGILMAIGIKFAGMLYLHVELSIIFAVACILHFIYRLKMYGSEVRFSFRKRPTI